MKNAVFWDVTPCWPCKNRRFRGTYRLHLQGRKLLATLRLMLEVLKTCRSHEGSCRELLGRAIV
jgi:hypothetical protein